MKWTKPIFISALATIMVVVPLLLSGQCNGIDFTPDQTQVCAPKLVKFFIQNNPVGASYSWDYGFGPANGKDTGQHIYTQAGTYTVTLNITLSGGTVCTVKKQNIIEVFASPVPFFSVSRPVLCNGTDTVTITDLSTGGISRNWTIEGLPYSDTSATIVTSFKTPGFKEVVLALNSLQCPTAYYKIDSAVRIYTPLSFDFVADTTKGCTPALITFQAKNITPGHIPGAYNWTFTGGAPSSSTQAEPAIQYNTGGLYSVALKLTNTDGCAKQLNKPDYLLLGDTTGFSIITSKKTGCRGDEFIVDLTNQTLSGNFTWDFGTGVAQVGSSPTSQHVIFYDTGTQSITVTRENNGCNTTKTFINVLTITPPLANFLILNPVDCDSTARVFVFNRCKPAPGFKNSYLWRLYDKDGNLESTSTDSIPVFYTSRNYNYSLELVIRSSNGCSDSSFRLNGISRRPGIAKFIITPDVSCLGNSIELVSTSGQFSSKEPNVYEWTIYDKNGTDILKFQNSGAYPSIKYGFSDTGSYSVSLRVYNSSCSDTSLVKNSIQIIKAQNQIKISDNIPCVKNTVLLDAITSPPSLYTYSWLIINSADTSIKYTASGSSVSITPDKPGDYNIRLVTQWGNNTCVDTLFTQGQMKISAPTATVSFSNPSGCLPLTGVATSSITNNDNYKNPGNNTITYNWFSVPSTGVTVSSPTSPSTQITFNAQGSYTIFLVATNGSGCSDTFKFSTPVNAGVIAGFSPNKSAVCVGDTTTINNQASLAPQTYKWYSVPSGPSFLPSANAISPKIIFPDSGIYSIYQVVSKNGICYDSVTHDIKSVKVIADFNTADTDKYCSPVPVSFINKSQNADSLAWYLGNGRFVRTVSVPQFNYVYFTNSGPLGYDIKLIAKNNLGCIDSITKTGYITILGPVPNFMVDTNVGCNPLTVKFTDSSTDYQQYYFDYDDGSNFDSTGNPGMHTYTNPNTLSEAKQYKPKVFLIDKQGCLAEFQYPGLIRVNNNPVIKFIAMPDSGCVPVKVAFKDSSQYATLFSWDFDNDGIEDSKINNPSYTYNTKGNYSVRLKVTSQYGCVTEDTLINYIHVFSLPTANFTLTKNDNDTASIYYTFANQSLGYSTMQWYADSMFIGSAPIFDYAFNDTGYHRVRLIAISDKGCRDTTDSTIFIVPDYFFHVPNAFTPNGKGGNETFGLYAPLWAKRFIMHIYNRYGELIFETTSMRNQWDGTFKNEPCQQDAYIYSIEYLDIYSKWRVFNGTVYLLR